MRIIRAGLAILVGAIVVVAFYDTILGWMLEPYANLCARKPEDFCGRSIDPTTGNVTLFTLDPIEGLTTRLKVSFYGGVVLALPVVLWQIWKFVVPALHKNERKYALGFVTSSVALFLLGCFIAFTTLEKALEFLIGWAGDDVDPAFRVESYIRLVTLMCIAFGVGFTIPVLLVFLELLEVLRPQTLLRAWRYALVGTFVVAAARIGASEGFITPASTAVFSMRSAKVRRSRGADDVSDGALRRFWEANLRMADTVVALALPSISPS